MCDAEEITPYNLANGLNFDCILNLHHQEFKEPHSS
jgi:hypothetical protein